MTSLTVFQIGLYLLLAATGSEFEFYPGARYDPQIPTLRQVVGHSWGEQISSPAEINKYVQALADRSPRVALVEYGRTWEGRPLHYLVVGSEANQDRLNQIRAGMRRLAEGRPGPDVSGAGGLLETLPVVVWLAYAVHGDEISSSDAALLTAYHLAAALGDPLTSTVLQNALVVIDPLQNPDGRERFVSYFRQTMGPAPDPHRLAAEHHQPWPGGRTNHYLFDMNRDWFARTQTETRARVKAYLEWFPQVFVDLHEMGSDSTYYFAPPAAPYNPQLTAAQIEWLRVFGRHNARHFDRLQFDYFTGEIFDSFYPGYGEGWPMFHGSIGMTYEQASAGGRVIDRRDGTRLHYREAVQHHFIASLATAETAARNREPLLRYFFDYRRDAAESADKEEVKEFILTETADSPRTLRMVSDLLAQGIQVKRAEESFTNGKIRPFLGGEAQSRQFPAGTYVVPLAQPARHLVRTLLDRETRLAEEFRSEQIRRYKKRLPDQFYDITGWSLILLHDVEAYLAEENSQGAFSALPAPPEPAGAVEGDPARLAYLVPWNDGASARFLAAAFAQDLKIHSSDKAFRLSGRNFPPGSLILKVRDNPADLHQRLQGIAAATGVRVFPTDTAWVEEGVNLGSEQVAFLKKPRLAMVYREPTSPGSAGWARYLIEQELGYPVTLIPASLLRRQELADFNVLILPDAAGDEKAYGDWIGKEGAARLKQWLEAGGTLVSIGKASVWLADKDVKLLASEREQKNATRLVGTDEEAKEKTEKQPEGQDQKGEAGSQDGQAVRIRSYESAIQPEEELPPSLPGAILTVSLDREHWTTFGYAGQANVLVNGRNIFRPLKLNEGVNAAVYMPEAELVLSGFVWEESLRQLPFKPYLLYQRHGRGQVVAFAEDPNFRAFCRGLMLLFSNALLLGPGHAGD